MAEKDNDRMAEPLVGDGRNKSWVETGTRVWNGTIVVLAVIFVVEAAIFFWLGIRAPNDGVPEESQMPPHSGNSTLHTVSQGKLEIGLGVALTMVAGSTTLLAMTQCCCDCCFKQRLLRMFYHVFSCLIIAFELVLVYIIVVIEQWDVFKEDAEGVQLAALSKTLKDCMWLLVPELIISVFMQIGAMVFACSLANQLRMQALEAGDFDAAGSSSCCPCFDDPPEGPDARYQKLFQKFNSGSRKQELKLGPKHVQRLESMRMYYAQLYMENGLDVPVDLENDDVRRRREHQKKMRAEKAQKRK